MGRAPRRGRPRRPVLPVQPRRRQRVPRRVVRARHVRPARGGADDHLRGDDGRPHRPEPHEPRVLRPRRRGVRADRPPPRPGPRRPVPARRRDRPADGRVPRRERDPVRPARGRPGRVPRRAGRRAARAREGFRPLLRPGRRPRRGPAAGARGRRHRTRLRPDPGGPHRPAGRPVLHRRVAGGDPRRQGGVAYGPRSGFALETQGFPDAPNRPEFPTTVLLPGEEFRSVTEFRFSVA